MKFEKSCGTITFNGDKVLLIKQKSGFCGFPKGHIEENESELETAFRETLEETNIKTDIDSNLRFSINYSINENLKKEVVYFVAKAINTNIKIDSNELIDAKWVFIEEVEEMLSFDNLRELWSRVLFEISKK